MAEATVPPKRRKTLLLVIGLVLLLVAIAAAAAFFLIRNKQLEAYSFGDDTDAQAQAAQAKKAPEKIDASKHVFAALEMFTANLADRDRERFAQIAVMIEVKDAKAETALKAVVPPIRSDILLMLTAKNAEDLLTLEGKRKLAQQILDIARARIASDFRGEVYAVHFSSFVIQ
ncbi:flagellar basal body-associated FliL family protein [Pigmentiphaga litoralis]|uniref:Flagellar protein FliL n=1 Tax=Pigmentiphaga litoralis TaxID=516702 RepID=A0A7Y9J0D5_9BURK|nr:flagellar basal body-associated FliL family protein [Pigmentiphaga litoralis]NYE26857.1 flagellar FliL protein [Pigmentiphaga litoralis]NYE85733.1 flagellar FliL protein [Pigmentiphaga litoralis]